MAGEHGAKTLDWKGTLVRCAVMMVGVLLIGAAVALSKHSLTGTSPISAIPAVVYDRIHDAGVPVVTLGMCSFAMNFLCLLVEVALLRRKFPVSQLLQLPVVLVMSSSVDVWALPFSLIPNDTYLAQLLLAVASTAILGLGAYLQVSADILMTPGDALVLVISRLSRVKYHKVKVAFDVTLVTIAAVLSLCFFGALRDVREGTLIAAVGTGIAIGLYGRALDRLVDRLPEGEVAGIRPVVPVDHELDD